MNEWKERYNRLVTQLTQLQQKQEREMQARNQQMERARAGVQADVDKLDEDIATLQTYVNTGQYYVTDRDRRRTPTPVKADMAALARQYLAVTREPNRGWNYIYCAARDGIAWLEQQKRRLSQQPAPTVRVTTSAELEKQCRDLLKGDDARMLARTFQELDKWCAPGSRVRYAYARPAVDEPCIVGKLMAPLPVTPGCKTLAGEIFGANFRKDSNKLFVPATIGRVTLLQTPTAMVNDVMSGMRALAFNFLCGTVPVRKKVFFIDAVVRSENCLGQLRDIARLSSTAIARVPQTDDEVRNSLQELLDLCTTDPGSRLLVYRYRPDIHGANCDGILQRLCNNARENQLTVLIVQELSERQTDPARCMPAFLPGDVHILRSPDGRCMAGVRSACPVLWYNEPKTIPTAFVTALCAAYAPPPLQTDYFRLNPVPRSLNLRRDRSKPISLFYGVDKYGRKYFLDLKGTDFSAFLLGAARSGKSNLLNVLITSAIMNYHPDDLELWLVDFGRTEFSRYVRNTPPHVRYVQVESTRELIRNLFRSLVEELRERGRILSRYGADKIDKLPDDVHMPRMLVIIDEFGLFKTAMSKSENGDKTEVVGDLTTLLKQGAKHGMHFIFADQTFSDSSSVLDDGVGQIGMRMTMMAEKSKEMLAVLGAESDAVTSAEQLAVTSLPPYQVMFRSRELGRRLHGPVHVLDMTTDAAKATQQQLIRQLNRELSPTGRSRRDASKVYCAKAPRLLSMDAVPTLKDREAAIAWDIRRWRANPAFNEGDLLLYPGDPRTMETVHCELLRNTAKNNIVVYGSYASSLEGLTSIVSSVAGCCAMQRMPVEYWCGRGNPMGKTILNSRALSGTKLENSRDVLRRLTELRRDWKAGTLRPGVIVLAGVAELIRSVLDDQAEEAARGGGGGASDLSGDIIRGLIARGDPDSLAMTPARREPEIDVRKTLAELLNFGPRYGLHFIVVAQRELELQEAGIQGDLYTHFMGFPTGGRDSQRHGFKMRTAELTESTMFGCLTDEGFTAYLPYRL